MKQKPVWRMEPDVVHGGWSVFKTIRTKPAKFERVSCRYCLGSGVYKTPYIGSDNPCGGCKGKGYRLEAINHAN
ncbi:hypothetical protein DN730_07905 [Marinomonas piezotolerans]|uniref:Uncharacterized protein n=1 Tax=Marinomonas piezotolerans TaxID=2213058 RepID=A0A370U957_9GAMM|nr:hypothetical protein [Marinomonas piezotolerans]RDL44320.1 hypothetical protein DN730_07905 [Marinomonas piezotolerans]